MPKKKTQETQEEQSARFRAEVERMIAAGELSPTEADASFDEIFLRQATKNAKRR